MTSDDEKDGNHDRQKRTIFSLALGIAIGISCFGLVFQPYVDRIMLNLEIRHGEALKIVQERLEMETADKIACLEDDSSEIELAEMRGKLLGRAAWARQVEELQAEMTIREQEYQEQREKIEGLTKERNQLHERLDRLLEQRQALSQQVQEMDSQSTACRRELSNFESQVSRYQERIRQREGFLAKEMYGIGPYYIQVTAKPRDLDSSLSFVVELASRWHMPHAVFSMLSAVKYELFNGHTFMWRGENVLGLAMGPDIEVEYNRKRMAVGMNDSILALLEKSLQFPCDEYSVSFSGNDAFEIYLSPSEDKSCVGKIVRGMESANGIREALSRGSNVDIATMEILEL